MDSDIPESGCIAIQKKLRSTQSVPPTLSPRSSDPQTGEWKLVVPMSKRWCGKSQNTFQTCFLRPFMSVFSLDVGAVLLLSDLLLCLCRWWPWRSVVYLNSKEHFDPQTNLVVWGSAHMAHMCRCSCSLWLSVCRWGQDGVSCLNYVERYDPKENKWSEVASMNTRRLVVAVAVLGGYVWVGQMAIFLLKLVINLFSWFSCRQCYY